MAGTKAKAAIVTTAVVMLATGMTAITAREIQGQTNYNGNSGVDLDASRHKAQLIRSYLMEIGTAFRVWAARHNGQLPFNVSQAQGGTRELSDRDSDGFEKNPVPIFMVMSNELVTPFILVCPDDETKHPAANFASLTISNISYQVRSGTNVSLDNPDPEAILVVDPIHHVELRCDGTVWHQDGGML